MEIWSATLRGDGRPHTFLGRVFAALEGRQRDYDFLLAGVEACPPGRSTPLSTAARCGCQGRS